MGWLVIHMSELKSLWVRSGSEGPDARLAVQGQRIARQARVDATPADDAGHRLCTANCGTIVPEQKENA